MRVKLRVQSSVIAKHDPQSFVCIDRPQFKISTKIMLQEITMVRRDLEPVRASHFHQCLIARLPRHRTFDLFRQTLDIAGSGEYRVEKGFASRYCRNMTYEKSIRGLS